MRAVLDTAGERVDIQCGLGWVADLLAEGAAGMLAETAGRNGEATVGVRVEASQRPFDQRGFEPLTRGAWYRAGEVVVENACTSGFDLHLRCEGERADFTFRWRPPARERLVNRLLRSRFHLVARAVLIQYPALWRSTLRGRAPLHVSACTAGPSTCLLAGPSGVGKSTLLRIELARGGQAACDNVCASDGVTAYGLVEPLRVEGGGGRRMPHGRRETPLPNRVPALRPDRLVVVRRGLGSEPTVRRCSPEEAARSLVAGTYMAGELRRFWGLAATLALGSGTGPAHPPVGEIAASLSGCLPGLEVLLPGRPGPSLGELLGHIHQEEPA